MPNRGVKGRIVDAVSGSGIDGLTVKVVDFDPFLDEDDVLATGTTKKGNFLLTYSETDYRFWTLTDADNEPDLVVQVFDKTGRLLTETKEVKEVTDEILDIPEIKIHPNNLSGWLVTNTTLHPEKGAPVSLSNDNEITHLVDGEAMFTRVTEVSQDAQSSINLSQLFFAAHENVITEFNEADFSKPPPKVPKDECKKLISAKLGDELKKKPNIPVNVMVANIPVSASDHAVEIKEFFKDTNVNTTNFLTGISLLHTKQLIADGNRAILMGSPLKQGYFNDTEHSIFDVRNDGSLKHDVSIEIAGPAVAQIDKTFDTIWKATGKTLATAKPEEPDQKDANKTATVQVVRTLPGGAFKNENVPAGETGILEAYQRAIANARRYIYLENQYITSEEIADALIRRMLDKDKKEQKLEIILVVNFLPDLPGYPEQQISHFRRLKDVAKANGHELGIYTLWSRLDKKASGGSVFDLMPIYVHSKMGIIDDAWATVGSANLDGTSLNHHQIGLMVTSKVTGLLDSVGNDPLKFVVRILLQLAIVVFSKRYVYTLGIIVALLIVAYKLVFDFKDVIKKIMEFMEQASELGDFHEMLKDVFARTSQHALPHRSRQPPRNVELNVVLYNNIAGKPETQVVNALRHQLWEEHLGLQQLPPALQKFTFKENVKLNWVKVWDEKAKLNLEAVKNNKPLAQGNAPQILPWVPETNARDYLCALGIRTNRLQDVALKYDFDECKFELPKRKIQWPI